MRSHYCGQIDQSLIGDVITVCGWVHRRRDHGGVIFVDLRDREGLLQVVFDPDREDIFAEAERIRSEFVLKVTGLVRERPEGTINENMPTGHVEVLAHELEVLNRSETPPFHHDEQANEELRLKYRYLDLRRENMLGNLMLRHQVTRAMRDFINEPISDPPLLHLAEQPLGSESQDEDHDEINHHQLQLRKQMDGPGPGQAHNQ